MTAAASLPNRRKSKTVPGMGTINAENSVSYSAIGVKNPLQSH